MSKLANIITRPIGETIATQLNRISRLSGDHPHTARGVLCTLFSAAIKNTPFYASLRARTEFSAQASQLGLKPSDYSAWSFKTISKGKVSPSQPINNPIICFPGEGGSEFESPQGIVSTAQYIEKTLKNHGLPSPNRKRILSYGYQAPSSHNTELVQRAEDQSPLLLLKDPKYCGPQAAQFVKEFFENRVFDLGKNSERTKLSPDTLSRRLRMTIAGYSAGGHFSRQVLNGLEKMMAEGGYDQSEIDWGMEQIFVLTIAGEEPVLNPHAAKSLKFLDLKDQTAHKNLPDFKWRPIFSKKREFECGVDSQIIWTDHAFDPDTAGRLASLVASKQNPQTIAAHIGILSDATFLTPNAVSALNHSINASHSLPSLSEMCQIEGLEPQQEVIIGQDAAGFDVYLSEALQTLSMSEEAIDTAANEGIKTAKTSLVALIKNALPDCTISNNKARQIATTFLHHVREDLQPDAERDISILEPQVA